jgi:hypothetical protein
MIHKKISPLSDKIVNYLSEYHDFVYYPIGSILKNHSDQEIFTSLDELELYDIASFRNYPSKKDADDIKPRVLNSSEIEGRMESQ